MKYLGIDFGLKKIGLAVADTPIVEPLIVVRYSELKTAIEEVVKVIKDEQINKLVIGISEGNINSQTKKFADTLKEKTNLPVVFQDEMLSTHDAQKLSIEAGIKRKKRKGLEDAYSAALILQQYLDTH